MFLIYGFVVGMTAGFTVPTAQKFGAGDMKGMRRTVAGAGILSQMLYNLLSSILRAIGNSKIPLYFLIISALLEYSSGSSAYYCISYGSQR